MTNDDFPNSAYHIEIDGVNVTGTLVLPTTDFDSWDEFQWIGKRTVVLDAGIHFLKIVSDRQYFDLNAIRVTAAATPTPFSGSPITIPATIQAEDFDLGGQDVAYHDNVPGNAGGQYRPSEDVDIVLSLDPAGGGYVVNNFETGEWLNYTINVPATGNYDIELRAVTNDDFPNSAFHIEIDGVNVTGTVVLPTTDTIGWSNFQWIGKRTFHLAAGTRFLKIVSEQQYFDLNSIRVTATPPSSATPQFRSGFEVATSLETPEDCWNDMLGNNGCWQDIIGTDNTTGDPQGTWPPSIWGGGGRFQLIVNAPPPMPMDPTTVGNYMFNRIEIGTGRNGSQALYSEVRQTGLQFTQDSFTLLPVNPQQGDLYISFWLKFQADLLQKMTPQNWRTFFEWKTANDDYRVTANVVTWGSYPQGSACDDGKTNSSGSLYWEFAGIYLAVQFSGVSLIVRSLYL